MPKIFTVGNHNSSAKSCNNISPITTNLMENPTTSCSDREIDVCDTSGRKKTWGHKVDCDPMQTGSIINDPQKPNRNVIYRYSNGLRGCDEGVTDLFRNVIVLDEDGKAHPIPIIHGSQEKAVAVIMQNNVRKDNTLGVDRLTLPLMAIHSSGLNFNKDRYVYHKAKLILNDHRTNKPLPFQELKDRDTVFGVTRGLPYDVEYTLYLWSLYIEDMNQILEQIALKFSPLAYINVTGVPWEITVRLDSISNNIDVEPGDQNIRVIKYQINLTAETYIPQPIYRYKSVQNIKTDFYNAVEEDKITTVYDRDQVGVNE